VQIYYAAGEHANAVALWEKLGKTSIDNYYRAKSEVDLFPNNITWLLKLEDNGKIADSYLAKPSVPLSREQAVVLPTVKS
jgi:hypothetical protein